MTRERGKGKREPAGMAKDFDFQMLVIYVMFKLTVQLACTTTTSDFALIAQLRSWADTIFIKLENLSIQQTDSFKLITLYTSNCTWKLDF